ncbi:MATE family efflux transporter [Psychrosphaera sp. 1_MG-2023]|uniref:MATE family efflux transporter n=1 Tax=Psychrosphaera sp. 1_MG-2023 TaxID=3062643 RepID=UPI0026E3210F|nr:MATE family efflux transporter [Psychrosphaera sp. 1_MG-2023]MDO6719013.1 MATE family efflux transporter [Psychrosphaera sp. 1_MG-2023]
MIQNIQHLWRPRGHANLKIWQLAWPMILANITVPLLGFVDTAVIGHLNSSDFLSGTALGSLVVTIAFWLLGFLRMSTTALASQAWGRQDSEGLSRVLLQGCVLAILLAVVILTLQSWLFQAMLLLVDTGAHMEASLYYAQQYFDIRIWIAPVSLLNLVFMGYLIGIGKTKQVLIAVIVCNLVNLIGDIVFVPILGLEVSGVALASVIAETCQFVLLISYNLSVLKRLKPFVAASYEGIVGLIAMNRVLFMRSALLQFCISFMTLYASRFGPNAVAVNAIMMQFFLFLSFALDGVAFALESLVGQQVGAKQAKKVRLFITKGFRFGAKFAIFYSLVYLIFANDIIQLMTNIEELHQALGSYYWIIIFMPLGSFMCFIFDGVFIGLGWVSSMRNSMFIATIVFVCAVSLNHLLGGENLGLWLAFWLFLFARGASQLTMLQNSQYVMGKVNSQG